MKLKKIIENILIEKRARSRSGLALLAFEDADYEVERTEKSSDILDAFWKIKRWAEDNGYKVEKPKTGESVFDYEFKKDGKITHVVRY